MKLSELTALWLEDCRMRKKRTIKDDEERVRWFVKHWDVDIEKINSEVVMRIRVLRTQEPGQRGAPLATASINRYMATLSSILHFALRMDWIIRMPHIAYMREENERRAWITMRQAERLLAELPRHLEPMVRYTLATGVRASNCTGLEWSHINMETKRVRVPDSQFKQGVVFSYPLNDDACTAIARANEKSRHPRLVFSYRGERIKNPNDKGFKAACRRARLFAPNVHGMEAGQTFRWHDLRHTWATWHVMAGTPVHVLKELGGWRTTSVVERYYHLAEAFTSSYADNVAFRNIREIAHL